jgi:hypothetical protein
MKIIYEQPGWKRPHSNMICQNIDVLLKVSEYNYDLTDSDFRDYARARLGWENISNKYIFLKWQPGGKFAPVNDPAEQETRKNEVRDVIYGLIKRQIFDNSVDQKIHDIAIAHLQDLWELFLNERIITNEN